MQNNQMCGEYLTGNNEPHEKYNGADDERMINL
jgi:hypothetical protein